jgi:hypothetical protein
VHSNRVVLSTKKLCIVGKTTRYARGNIFALLHVRIAKIRRYVAAQYSRVHEKK